MESLKKINLLRDIMKKEGAQCFLFSTADEYINEYVSDDKKRLEYLTGFSGSYAFCVVGLDKAAIFVDSRYTIQANNQVDQSVFEIEDLSLQSIVKWVSKNIGKNDCLHLYSKITQISEFQGYEKLFNRNKIKIKFLDYHLVDKIWQDKIVTTYFNPIELHNQFGSDHYSTKIKNILDKVSNSDASILITALDSIAWILNLRGSDIEYNPLFYSALIINKQKSYLFVKSGAITEEVRNYFDDTVVIYELEELESILSTQKSIILNFANPVYFKLFCEKNNINYSIEKNYVSEAKTVKNSAEIKAFTNANYRNSLALIKLLHFLDTNKKQNLNELKIGELIDSFFSEDKEYKGLSFDAIVGVNKNSALPHYKSTPSTCLDLDKKGYLLIDCGAQYPDGTTDMTRVLSFEHQGEDFKMHYTLVLKSHIEVATLVFKSGTTGGKIDLLARKEMWEFGLDFGHGTGHGVGFALCVHEGPISISPFNNSELAQGMILSNEPGLYFSGKYGIRLENLYFIEEAFKDKQKDEFLKFTPVTMVPFDVKNINFDMLDKKHIDWLHNYHQQILELFKDKLTEEQINWFKQYTQLNK